MGASNIIRKTEEKPITSLLIGNLIVSRLEKIRKKAYQIKTNSKASEIAKIAVRDIVNKAAENMKIVIKIEIFNGGRDAANPNNSVRRSPNPKILGSDDVPTHRENILAFH
jgi:hypothetical protein